MAGETFVYSFTQSNIGTSAQITDKYVYNAVVAFILSVPLLLQVD